MRTLKILAMATVCTLAVALGYGQRFTRREPTPMA